MDVPSRGYLIATTPRSGSNLLGQVLASTGALGNPLEWFNGAARRELGLPDYPDDPRAQLREVLGRGAGPNGVYGVKAFPPQLGAVAARVPDWERGLPGLRYVVLERRDLLGQAVSLVRAEQSGQYRSTSPAGASTSYDRAAIAEAVDRLAWWQARWRAFLATRADRTTWLDYDEVARTPQSAAQRVADLLSLGPVRVDTAAVDLHVQSDEQSLLWRERYVEESPGDAPPSLGMGWREALTAARRGVRR